MKAIIKLKGIFLISLLTMACATAPFKVPDKYNFDNQLKEATDISSFRIDSWQSIDNQSLIIRTNVNDYYLLILDRHSFALPFSESIGITLAVDRVKSGFDRIIVTDSAGTESYLIHKIYKLSGREQATEIKKQIRSQRENK
jgi:hypothetical protein